MDSESSSKSIESTPEKCQALEIEIEKAQELETNSTAAANPGINPNILDPKFTLKWVMATIIIAFTTLLTLLGNILPEKVFGKHPKSFVLFLMLLLIAFYSALIGLIFSSKFPDISWACNLIALVGGILIFTVPIWSLLPPGFSLLPWIFFVVTFGALMYQCTWPTRPVREQRRRAGA